MEPKPVIEGRFPTYPTRRDVLAGAAAFGMAALGGPWRVFAATSEGKIVVAPLFEHGKGHGATGCMAISPPVFLSEDEAMQVIREELAKYGVVLKATGPLKNVRIPGRELEYKEVDDGKGGKTTTREIEEVGSGPFKPTGLDAKKKVAVALVSHDNYAEMGGPLDTSTAQSYNFKGTVEWLATKLKGQGDEPIFLGLLYDPAAPQIWPDMRGKRTDRERNEAFRKAEEQSKVVARKLLREQVDDFAAWLKKQKVIEERKR